MSARAKEAQEAAAGEPEDIVLSGVFLAIPFKRPGQGVSIVPAGIHIDTDLLQGPFYIEEQSGFVKIRGRGNPIARKPWPPLFRIASS